MYRTTATLAAALAATFALPALAQDATASQPGGMTPDQAAMMQAYVAAGTPGKQHAMLASAAGDYDLVVRSWDAPGAPPSEETGTATRKMVLGGRVMVEQVSSNDRIVRDVRTRPGRGRVQDDGDDLHQALSG